MIVPLHAIRSLLGQRLPNESAGLAADDQRSHNPVPRRNVDQILVKAYSTPAKRCHIQQLALLYSIFSVGTLHSLEYEPNDPIAEEYRQLSQACLSKGDFMIQNTISGVQALVCVTYSAARSSCFRRTFEADTIRSTTWHITTRNLSKARPVIRHGRCGAWRCDWSRRWACIGMDRGGISRRK